MAKRALGEISLNWEDGDLTLRLPIGTLMELEDHLGTGLVTAMQTRFADMTVADLSMLLLALTGRDFRDRALIITTAEKILENDMAQVMGAVAECLRANLAPALMPRCR